jgi:hypothetical protein
MATIPLGPDSAPVTLPGAIPPAPAVMAILDRFNRDELGNAIEVLVALLDIWDGDADTEPNGDDEAREADGDTRDAAWIEWDRLAPGLKGVSNITGRDNEDDEEDDAREEDDGDSAVDDYGCDDINDDREEEHDMESEQMPGDVPMLPVFTAEHNVFTDARVPLGFSNLQTSFVGQDIRSADTGALHSGKPPNLTSQPGVPV